MLRITHSSINQKISKELPPYERLKSRINPALSHTGLSWYTQKYFEYHKTTMSAQPAAAAQWLAANHPFTGD